MQSCSGEAYQTESQIRDAEAYGSLHSDPETKAKLIRHVQQYLEKDIDKFLVGQSCGRRQEKLFRYSGDMIKMVNEILQNSCEMTIKQIKSQ